MLYQIKFNFYFNIYFSTNQNACQKIPYADYVNERNSTLYKSRTKLKLKNQILFH